MHDEEVEVVEVFVSGVSMAGKSELKNDSDRPVEEDQTVLTLLRIT